MELQNYSANLPDTIEDLSKFVLIGREKLTAVRAEIRAIEKVGLAKEVYDQKLAEAQEIAEIVLDAETQMGRLLQEVPKESGNQYTKLLGDNGVTKQTPRQEIYKSLGSDGTKKGDDRAKQQVKRFQDLAKHPEEVERAKAEARERGTVVRRQDVFSNIKPERPVPSKKKRIEEIKQERKEFEERKNDDVISLNDVKADKGNARIIALQMYQDILKTVNTVNELLFNYSRDEIDEYVAILEEDKVNDILSQLGYAESTISTIKQIIGRRN